VAILSFIPISYNIKFIFIRRVLRARYLIFTLICLIFLLKLSKYAMMAAHEVSAAMRRINQRRGKAATINFETFEKIHLSIDLIAFFLDRIVLCFLFILSKQNDSYN